MKKTKKNWDNVDPPTSPFGYFRLLEFQTYFKNVNPALDQIQTFLNLRQISQFPPPSDRHFKSVILEHSQLYQLFLF